VTLSEYLRAWNVLDERERLAFDLATFCGLRESESYGLKKGTLFEKGAIRVERSWYRGEINPTKTDQIREVEVDLASLRDRWRAEDQRSRWVSSLRNLSKITPKRCRAFPASSSRNVRKPTLTK
jgi:hypothetical protein